MLIDKYVSWIGGKMCRWHVVCQCVAVIFPSQNHVTFFVYWGWLKFGSLLLHIQVCLKFFLFSRQIYLIQWAPCFENETCRGKQHFFPYFMFAQVVSFLIMIIFSCSICPLQLGYDIDGDQLDNIFWRFKAVAEQKKVGKSAVAVCLTFWFY